MNMCPSVIKYEIAKHLNFRDLFNFLATCKSNWSLYFDQKFFRYLLIHLNPSEKDVKSVLSESLALHHFYQAMLKTRGIWNVANYVYDCKSVYKSLAIDQLVYEILEIYAPDREYKCPPSKYNNILCVHIARGTLIIDLYSLTVVKIIETTSYCVYKLYNKLTGILAICEHSPTTFHLIDTNKSTVLSNGYFEILDKSKGQTIPDIFGYLRHSTVCLQDRMIYKGPECWCEFDMKHGLFLIFDSNITTVLLSLSWEYAYKSYYSSRIVGFDQCIDFLKFLYKQKELNNEWKWSNWYRDIEIITDVEKIENFEMTYGSVCKVEITDTNMFEFCKTVCSYSDDYAEKSKDFEITYGDVCKQVEITDMLKSCKTVVCGYPDDLLGWIFEQMNS